MEGLGLPLDVGQGCAPCRRPGGSPRRQARLAADPFRDRSLGWNDLEIQLEFLGPVNPARKRPC